MDPKDLIADESFRTSIVGPILAQAAKNPDTRVICVFGDKDLGDSSAVSSFLQVLYGVKEKILLE